MENENLKPKKIFKTTREKDTLHTGEQCSTSVIKEMQIKPTARYHLTPTTMHRLEKPDNPSRWWACGMPRMPRRYPQEFKAYYCSGNRSGSSIKTYLPPWPSALTKTLVRKTRRRKCRAVLFTIANIWAQPNVLMQENRWTNQDAVTRYRHTQQHGDSQKQWAKEARRKRTHISIFKKCFKPKAATHHGPLHTLSSMQTCTV